MTNSIRKTMQDKKNNLGLQNTIKKEKNFILPFDLVLDYIKNHQVYKNSSTKAQDIYNGVNLFLESTKQVNGSEPDEEIKLPVVKPNCTHCHQGYYELDEHSGVNVCSNCGVVKEWTQINVTPEFFKEAEFDVRKTTKSIRGVTNTVKDICDRYSDSYISNKKDFMEELLHLNVWVNVPLDYLNFLNISLINFEKNNSVSRSGKIIGALLSYYLKNKVVSEETFRNCIKNKQTVPLIRQTEGRFSCVNCNQKCHTLKESKFHCKIQKTYSRKFS